MATIRKHGLPWYALVFTMLTLSVCALGLGGTYVYLKADLPALSTIGDYNPPQTTRVFSDDGQLVGRFFHEHRTVVPIERIPIHVIHAFLAAEDADFYQHQGLDYWGILRAAVKNLRPGAHLQGASTITQQTVKTLVLGPERSYSRKMREAILARELEQMFTKDEILHLYLNQIYFGASAYGVEEAAQTYFGKSVAELDLGEAALLAGIPKNPAKYGLTNNPEAAKERQLYVLQQMLRHGWASPEAVSQTTQQTLPQPPPPPPFLGKAPAYLDHVRQILSQHYGEKAVHEEGLTVYVGMSAEAQVAAQRDLRGALEELTLRQGYVGADLRIEVDSYERDLAALKKAYDEALARQRTLFGDSTTALFVWDLAHLSAQNLTHPRTIASAMQLRPLTQGMRVRVLVVRVDSVDDEIDVALGCCTGRMRLESLTWAGQFSPKGPIRPPRDVTDVLHRGDVVTVEVTSTTPSTTDENQRPVLPVALVPRPRLEGALVAIDPHTRLVRALVGGYEQRPGDFNRAIQALRQPGSAFKPVIYAAALAERAITPASTCADTPIIIRDNWTGKAWKPQNYEDDRYDGNITFRSALMHSKNTCSVKLIEKIGPGKAIAMARALGINSPLPENLTLALGTGEVRPIELANAYATIAAGGLYASPIFVRKVKDHTGQVREENRAEPEQVLDAAVSYVLTSMMRSVVEEGTGRRALVLDRPLAGKTGTTNMSRDTWFAGFSPELVTTVWVGFDDNASLGRLTGASGALPLWIRFMGDALNHIPHRDFAPPPGVVFVRIDAETGAPSEGVGSIEQAFIAGTEPQERTAPLPSIFTEDEPL